MSNQFWWRELPEGSLVRCVGTTKYYYKVGEVYTVDQENDCSWVRSKNNIKFGGFYATFAPIEMSLEGVL